MLLARARNVVLARTTFLPARSSGDRRDSVALDLPSGDAQQNDNDTLDWSRQQARSAEFSWKQSADAMRSVLESVVAGNRVTGVV